ncbi:DUF4269 domain-containing protein [Bacillus sp. AK031]
MKTGNEKQRMAYKAVGQLGILEELKAYAPIVCGTIPIGIDVENSDLDIIMDVGSTDTFEKDLLSLYKNKQNFRVKRTTIREREVIKANFIYEGFEFELFGQSENVLNQHAYLHMIIEYKLLQRFPSLKEKVIRLKKNGIKTEPAFCMLLIIEGDPYTGLIQYGIKNGLIQRLCF